MKKKAKKSSLKNEANGYHEFFELMVEKQASDLHLWVPSPPVLRINGTLTPLDQFPPVDPKKVEMVFDNITTPEQKKIFQEQKELDFAYSIPGLARLRVNAMSQRGTISLAFRMVPFEVPSIDELGIPQICKKLALRPRGLVLITGPTGCGKSTTLATMINHINENDSRTIISIEDPIEYLHSNKKCLIAQRELGDDTMSYAKALVHALRHDPDVLVVGEMRNMETMRTALTAAETGHLVLGTLHTVDAVQSIHRIVDMFPHAEQEQIITQLSQVIEAILSQTLLPRIDGGRVAAFEVMIANSAIRKLIRERRIFELTRNMEFSTKEEGMHTLDQALAELVKNGIVSVEDAVMKSSNPAKFSKENNPQGNCSRFELLNGCSA
jgi:twitching motility protein PilT